jgi:hypothetical protein
MFKNSEDFLPNCPADPYGPEEHWMAEPWQHENEEPEGY